MTNTKPLIAVVDDDPSVLRSLARLLRSAGYTASPFGSAQEFLGSIATSLPQCLVLDVQMPRMNGFELKFRLKGLGHDQLPVVFITAHDTPQTRALAWQSGFVGLLIKPFEDTALLGAIGQAINGRQLDEAERPQRVPDLPDSVIPISHAALNDPFSVTQDSTS